MKKIGLLLIILIIVACANTGGNSSNNGNSNNDNTTSDNVTTPGDNSTHQDNNSSNWDNTTSGDNKSYILHSDIISTVFWTGEKASQDNKMIANIASAWDDMWMENYGGVDSPENRNGYFPADFTPDENPFYVALPFNDFDAQGNRKADLQTYIPWQISPDTSVSVCKNRWVKITKMNSTAYAQWEDVGPFGEDDKDYVFGHSLPKNQVNAGAGIDVSPAVRDYLDLDDIDTVDWQFVDYSDVPNGPWKNIITTSNVNWINWFKPDINSSWQWQLQGDINTSYNVNIYDIDLFDTPQSTINELHNKGIKVICYFSAGSYENWREDKNLFPAEAMGKDLDGWEGEKWIDIRNSEVKSIMQSRLDLAREKGCDGVEPDNVDGYTNDTGFNLTFNDQLAYNKFLAKEAHKRGLSIGLKNDLNQIVKLEPHFDFAINEQCFEYDECDLLQPFTNAGKPVLNVEYNEKYVNNLQNRNELCNKSNLFGFYTLILPLALDDSFRISCK